MPCSIAALCRALRGVAHAWWKAPCTWHEAWGGIYLSWVQFGVFEKWSTSRWNFFTGFDSAKLQKFEYKQLIGNWPKWWNPEKQWLRFWMLLLPLGEYAQIWKIHYELKGILWCTTGQVVAKKPLLRWFCFHTERRTFHLTVPKGWALSKLPTLDSQESPLYKDLQNGYWDAAYLGLGEAWFKGRCSNLTSLRVMSFPLRLPMRFAHNSDGSISFWSAAQSDAWHSKIWTEPQEFANLGSLSTALRKSSGKEYHDIAMMFEMAFQNRAHTSATLSDPVKCQPVWSWIYKGRLEPITPLSPTNWTPFFFFSFLRLLGRFLPETHRYTTLVQPTLACSFIYIYIYHLYKCAKCTFNFLKRF